MKTMPLTITIEPGTDREETLDNVTFIMDNSNGITIYHCEVSLTEHEKWEKKLKN